MIQTAGHLFQRNGYHATSWRTLVETAGTPWGSAHHHFPGGKEELGVAAVDMSGEQMAASIEQAFAASRSAADAVRAWCAASAERLKDSDFVEGCPIATVALETSSESHALATATRRAFDRWRTVLARRFAERGVRPRRAEDLATLVLAALEGALLVARVNRSTEPILVAGEHLAQAIAAEERPLAKKRVRR
jgi:TetR/AcrR family transcriptional repressor of lmrAB and yxaGH operons